MLDRTSEVLEKLYGFLSDLADVQDAKPVEGVKEEDDTLLTPAEEFIEKCKKGPHIETDGEDAQYLWDNGVSEAQPYGPDFEVPRTYHIYKPGQPWADHECTDRCRIEAVEDRSPGDIAKANGSWSVPEDYVDSHDSPYGAGEVAKRAMPDVTITRVEGEPWFPTEEEVVVISEALNELLDEVIEEDEPQDVPGPNPYDDNLQPPEPEAGRATTGVKQTPYEWEQGLGVYIIGDRYGADWKTNKIAITFEEYLDKVLLFLVDRYEADRFFPESQVAGEVAESLGDFGSPDSEMTSLREILEAASQITTQLGPNWLQK